MLPELVPRFCLVCNATGPFICRPFILEVGELVLAHPKFNLGPRNFLSAWLGLALGLCTRLSSRRGWVCRPSMVGKSSVQNFPRWDPFWSCILAFHIITPLAGRRRHGPLGVGRFDYSLTVESFLAIHFLNDHKERPFDSPAFY